MGALKKINNFFSKISSALSYVSMAIVFLLMVILIVDIILRYFFKSGLLGSLELIEMGMVMLIFCGFAYTETVKGHVRVDILLNKIKSRRARCFIDGIVYIFMSVIGFAVTYASFMKVAKEGASTGVLLIPLVPFEMVMGIGMALFTLVLFLEGLISVTKTFLKEEPEEEESVMVPSH